MKSKPVAWFLWLISGFGCLGFHRAYLGKTFTAVLWFFTGGLSFVGALYDAFTLSRQVDEVNYALSQGYPGSQPSAGEKPVSLEERVYRAASSRRAVLTATELAMEAHISREEAEAELTRLAKKGACDLRVRESGAMVFFFPELMQDESDHRGETL